MAPSYTRNLVAVRPTKRLMRYDSWCDRASIFRPTHFGRGSSLLTALPNIAARFTMIVVVLCLGHATAHLVKSGFE